MLAQTSSLLVINWLFKLIRSIFPQLNSHRVSGSCHSLHSVLSDDSVDELTGCVSICCTQTSTFGCTQRARCGQIPEWITTGLSTNNILSGWIRQCLAKTENRNKQKQKQTEGLLCDCMQISLVLGYEIPVLGCFVFLGPAFTWFDRPLGSMR